MATSAREWWRQRRQRMEDKDFGTCSSPFMIPSVKEVAAATMDTVLHRDEKHSTNAEEERRLTRARDCTNAGVKAGVEAGAYAAVVSSVATFAGVRFIPWAKANLNYTAQALIISAATVGTYFIVTEKTILACSREGSYARLERERASSQST
ncbi:hypothetical protein R1flu_028961 [Riccia fluitans]|uniref:Early nodulin-93 n=1 Tax=Riccia fluitans TaxID=41844 RepID=A0ABD1XN56_9MARC